jgi:hypothetical protein
MFLFIAGLITGIVAGLVVLVISNAVMINYVRRLRRRYNNGEWGYPDN